MRFKMFISGAQREFTKERKALADYIRKDVILNRFFDVFLFEEVPAQERSASGVYLAGVDECDIYLCIAGAEYGNVDRKGVSATERSISEPRPRAGLSLHNWRRRGQRMAEAKVIEVVGGIIRRGDRYLLGRRPLGKSQGGKWEFIGGKIEPGETPEQALARECMEEIALPIINAKIRTSVTHAYPGRTIHLTLIDCEPVPAAEPKALEHAALGWFTAADALKLDFCPADIELLPVVFNN